MGVPSIRKLGFDDVEAARAIGVAAGERFRAIADPRVARCADDAPIAAAVLIEALEAGRAWVSEEHGAVVGFLVAEVLDGAGHIEEVSVHPDAGGRGHGRALLEAAAAWAAAAGFEFVTLTTFDAVAWNRPFYERSGFAVLPAEAWGVGLCARVAAEADAGLDPAVRVVMRRAARSRTVGAGPVGEPR